ncbi:DUF1326 domain-containing protein [Rhizobium sp. TRM95111]|uniref:DUF1326 domain-containing protein n=1 Tax=Rhizobium alarense TaxID=2846851 RepID=UPI001F27B45F|nr:DUF1326 domain-containing protein [Rhizobium alarense]MCF3639648.1 DUF1326 domain-containing protein [Rhizobium alarense]
MTPWEIDATEIANCNCNFGCPCQFNSLPTYGSCEAAAGFIIKKGHFGDVRLDGVKMALTVKWPGPIHLGNGTMQLVVDSGATPEQREAVEKIVTGSDTEDMATMFWVFSKMSPNRLETLTKRIDAQVDVETRTGYVRVADVFELGVEPIRNPVTGTEHRARINLPHGFEYRVAEMASGTTKTFGAIPLEKNKGTHAHICRVYMNGHGVIDHAA